MQKKEGEFPKISLIITTCGRYDYLRKTQLSLLDNVIGKFYERIIVDDSCSNSYRAENLREVYNKSGFTKIVIHEARKGFAGAYHSAFNAVSPESEYTFILEDDFTFNEPIDLMKMVDILRWNPKLCQVALKRQAWNKAEIKAGGIVECDPDSFEDQTFWDLTWCEHRKFFTTNPSLVPMWVIQKGWPLCERSEGVFTHELFKDPEVKSAYLGHKFDNPKVHHIGEVRNGINY